MIRGIHYFSAEVKPKLMSSQGAALNIYLSLKHHWIGDSWLYANRRPIYFVTTAAKYVTHITQMDYRKEMGSD